MFIEFTTKKNEIVYMNINRILLITPGKKGGTNVIDIDGLEFNLLESYSDFISRLEKVLNS